MDIQARAYEIGQERQAQGLPGDATSDWFQAEAELKALNLMNDQNPQIEASAYPPGYVYTVPPWPPPSGGAPITTPELGPITNPYPYGSPQPANISTVQPAPPFNGIKYPQKMPVGANGQNQGPGYGLPATTKPWEVGPIKADPSISAGKPPYIMGPGPQGTQPYEVGPIAGNPAPGTTFPAGHYIDGLGTTVTPTRVVGGLGN